MNHQRLQQQREALAGKIVIGIDPAKDKHQAAVVDAHGNQRGASFSFPVTAAGYGEILWRNIAKVIPSCNAQSVVVAIETACNLWETLAFYLRTRGYSVVLVSPLSTHHSRPIMSMEFSRTDPKDAYLIATIAQRGAYHDYEQFSSESNAMHQLSITYDKLRKNRAQNRARIRSLLDRVFPEFPRILEPDTDTAVYLLRKYLFPDEFLALDIRQEAKAIEKISRCQCGRETLEEIQHAACTTIGIVRQSDERLADRITLDAYLALVGTLEVHLAHVLDALITRAKEFPQFERINSLSGCGKKLTALFLGEVRDLSRFKHYRHLEKLAGLNLRLYDSGRYSGTRHISSIGNNRLRWIVYMMTEETARRVPEVRIKYLRRQLKRRKHIKNVVAAVPQLLQLIIALEKQKHAYTERPETVATMHELEAQYEELKSGKRAAA